MKLNKFIITFTIFAFSTVFGVSNVSAYVGGSSDGGVSGGGCAPAWTSNDSWDDTCHGATWKWYPTDSNDVYIEGFGNISGGHIRGCARVGGYWRYGLDHFHTNGDIRNQSYGDQRGLVAWNSVVWDAAHSDTQDINELREIFNAYADEFANLGFNWDEGNFSAFCAGKESSKKTTFQGHTTINVANSAKIVKSGWDNFKADSYETTNGSVKITFTHEIKRTDNQNVATNVKWKLATADDGLSASKIGTNNDRTMNFSANERNGDVKDAETTTYTIKLDPGATKTICQGVNHELAVQVKADGTRTHNQPGTRGSSKACITIKRKGVDVHNTSSADTERSFIGEKSTIAKSGAHTIYFYVGSNIGQPSSSQVAGGATREYGEGESSQPGPDDTAAANSAICSNFSSLCRSYSEATSNTVVIPDDSNLVGAKICAASSSKNSVFKETRTRTKSITYIDSEGNSVEESVTESYDVYTYYWQFSDVSCSPIAKKPNFRVTGGATYSAGKITTSKSSKVDSNNSASNGLTFGSWSEYLAVAGDTVKNYGSGATLRGGSKNSNLAQNSPLTIANESSPIGHSGISSDSFVSGIKSRFSESGLHGNIWVYNSSGTVNIGGGDNPLTIPNDDNLHIIFAQNINIYNSANTINAWLIADNTINTCADLSNTESLSVNFCNQPLTINGIAYAQNFKLYRTAGALAGNNSADSAETFNLPAGDYVRTYTYASTHYSQPVEVYTQELAPRI